MHTVQLDKNNYRNLESIVKSIAERNSISDVTAIGMKIDKKSGIISFRQNKEAAPLLIPALVALIGTFMYNMAQDPDINKLIDDMVQAKIGEGSVAGQDKDKYVSLVKDIVYDGASKVVEEFKQQEQSKQQQNSQNVNVQPKLQQNMQFGYPTNQAQTTTQPVQQQAPKQDAGYNWAAEGFNQTSKIHNMNMDFMKFAEEAATPGILGKITSWGADLANDTVTNLKNFFTGATVSELAKQISDMSARKGYIPKDYVDQFAQYITEFVSRGFQEAEQAVATKQKEQGGKGGQGGDQGKYERDQNGQQVQYQRADGGIAYRVDYSDGKPSIYVTAEPPNTLVDAGQVTGKVQNQNTTSEAQQAEQQQMQQQVPAAPQLATASFRLSRREKQAALGTIMEWILEKALRYGPYVLAIIKIALEIMKNQGVEDTVAEEEPIYGEAPVIDAEYEIVARERQYRNKEAGLSNFISNRAKNILNGVHTKLLKPTYEVLRNYSSPEGRKRVETFLARPEGLLLQMLIRKSGISANDIDAVVKSAPILLEKIHDAITFIDLTIEDINAIRGKQSPMQEKPTTKTEQTTEEPLKQSNYLGDVMKINSNVFSIDTNTAYYKDIENIVKRVASENSIKNVTSVEIEVTKEGTVARFNKQADMNWAAALASVAAGQLFGKDESMAASLGKGLEAGFTNMGATMGQSIAKYMGAGFLGQMAAGGIGAIAWGMLFGGDDKKKTESMNNEAYQNTVSDPAMQQFFDALKQKYPNVPDNIIWQQVVKMMSRIEGKM